MIGSVRIISEESVKRHLFTYSKANIEVLGTFHTFCGRELVDLRTTNLMKYVSIPSREDTCDACAGLVDDVIHIMDRPRANVKIHPGNVLPRESNEQ